LTSTARIGVTLVEVLVALVIIAVVAGVVVPTIFGQLQNAVVRRESSDLSTVAAGIQSYHDQVGAWPSSLSQLITAPAPGALNPCGGTLAIKDTARWMGRYLTLPVSADGLIIYDDTIVDTLYRVTSPSPTSIQITLKNVGAAARLAIQAMLDNDVDSTTGTIRWTNPPARLTYNLPISGC
jgi:prepilin-type N-terminal cleavage/methylation domain-containing protein